MPERSARRFPFGSVGLLVLLLFYLAGCGGSSRSASTPVPPPAPVPGGGAPAPAPNPTPSPSSPPALLYAGNSTDHDVSGFQINGSTGALTAIPGSPFSTGPVSDGGSAATDPAGHFLYVPGDTMLNCTNLCSGGIVEFTINPANGALTPAPGSPLLVGSGFSGSGVHPSGKFFYATDINLNQVYGFSINSSGALTAVPGSPFNLAAGNPQGLAFHGSGQFLYVAHSESNSISAFQINSAGTLFQVPGSPFSVGAEEGCPPAKGIASCASSVAVTGNFLYYVNAVAGETGTQEGSNVVAFTINPTTGALTPMSGSPFANAGQVADRVLPTPNGKFLYVLNVASNNVTAYTVDPSNGQLTSVPGSPFTTGTLPSAMVTDPAGAFLYVTNTADNSVSAYAISSQGALTPVSGSPFHAGGAPTGLAAAR